jgi:hypothetical protein
MGIDQELIPIVLPPVRVASPTTWYFSVKAADWPRSTSGERRRIG